ncbi:MAG TPA: hypothetical protein VHJ20_24145 [Polyangia bacterium]|nr:hypothetical protein [Polyangia bacterium]
MPRILFAFALVFLAACGLATPLDPPYDDAAVTSSSPDGAGGNAGLARDEKIATLSPDELGQLCDEVSRLQGGYGVVHRCPDGSTVATDDSRSSCVASAGDAKTTCPRLTVGDVEDCGAAFAQEPCSIFSAPGCKALINCGN